MVYHSKIEGLIAQYDQITDSRKSVLVSLAQAIKTQLREKNESKVTFICTHNSRRSQLAELWLRVGCHHYDVSHVHAHSGGTEVTAFNPRMIAALSRYGYTIEQLTEQPNPHYHVLLDQDEDSPHMYSKVYDDPANPQKDFIAVMVCDQAAEACPIIPYADQRIPLMYVDPKAHDDTIGELAAYDATVLEIGREILFVTSLLADA